VDLESRQSASQITTVDLAVNWGTPIHRASGMNILDIGNICLIFFPGVLYGVPNTKSQIPSTFYTSRFLARIKRLDSEMSIRHRLQLP
jgi:hypothetical protein